VNVAGATSVVESSLLQPAISAAIANIENIFFIVVRF
jgi:hypothetical protein